MPNWCFNELIIKSKNKNAQDLRDFFAKHLATKEFFDTVIPSPKRKEDCPPDCIVDNARVARIQPDEKRPWFNWYEWRNKFWGVKWEASDIQVDSSQIDSRKRLQVTFDTPWGPPTQIIDSLRKQYPNLNFGHYWEVE